MRLIPNSPTIMIPADVHSKLFVQVWYGLVHRNSLDSHRVRCMNSCNLLRELQNLFSNQALMGDKVISDISKVASEALDTFGNDIVLRRHYAKQIGIITPLLKKLAVGEKKSFHESAKFASYFIKDFLKELSDSYKPQLIADLRKSIFETPNVNEIINLTGILLTQLIDDGQSIEGLFSLCNEILIRKREERSFDFKSNFEFLGKIVSRPKTQFAVIFRLEGCSRPSLFPAQIAGIHFNKEVEVTTDNEQIKSYISPAQGRLFAQKKIDSEEVKDAGFQVSQEIEDVLDLIRFELEHERISVSQDFVAIREEDRHVFINKLPSNIPNPRRNINEEEFRALMSMVSEILNNEKISPETKDKIKSAFRYYRMGRDSVRLENTFLNWWTALEYLATSGSANSIIANVEEPLVAALSISYLPKLIRSYRDTISKCGVRPQTKTCEKYGIKNYKDCAFAEFFALFHDAGEFAHIMQQLGDLPAVKFKLQSFQDSTKNPKACSDFLKLHEKHLRWHIHRIWRVRCDIVHSANYTLNLTLLSANLEQYLKTLLLMTLEELTKNPVIDTISELYDRLDFSLKALHKELENGNAVAIREHLSSMRTILI